MTSTYMFILQRRIRSLHTRSVLANPWRRQGSAKARSGTMLKVLDYLCCSTLYWTSRGYRKLVRAFVFRVIKKREFEEEIGKQWADKSALPEQRLQNLLQLVCCWIAILSVSLLVKSWGKFNCGICVRPRRFCASVSFAITA